MAALTRIDTSVIGRWWWTVDRWTLITLAVLILIGTLLTMAASPPVADRLGLDSFHFVRRHAVLMPIAMTLIMLLSLANPEQIRRIAAIGFLVSLLLVALTMLMGQEIKGAQRWISLGGFSLQPSELVKPFFVVVIAWLLSEQKRSPELPGFTLSFALGLLVTGLLVLQPDLGMAVVVSAVWVAQVFLCGLSWYWIVTLAVLGVGAMICAYFVFPHVSSRIDRFLDPEAGDRYQIDRSLEAFVNGGLIGRGPGEGTVKAHLPDAHADFILAVAGEEFGAVVCVLLVVLFASIVLRGYARLMSERDLFVVLAAGGLLTQFGLQALVNMGSSLDLIPTKGMTLPFISYGGSSMLGLAIGMGMLLGLTRRRPVTGRATARPTVRVPVFGRVQ
ncbi:MAG: putative peptidoglycan glycosyltransferase FtsW [Alphaproteobacteria bacterium]|nr:putative peptidoglycan glycosyltransferase FtsW [Alphaproteobacteria bacterium]